MREKQPNSRHCFVCGLENSYGLGLRFYEVGSREVEANVIVGEQYQGYPGLVHGGIVAAMMDEVLARAAMIEDHQHFRMTAKMEIRYRQPVPTGEPLHLTGKIIRQRSRFAVARAELHLPDGSLGVEAEGILADLQGAPSEKEELEALGWKIYPD
ncbi:MAG: hotdog fold thioesterase [Anaerolineales bacterium]|nr:hotdog fold thioesterase [Anaerolineales bacterium]